MTDAQQVPEIDGFWSFVANLVFGVPGAATAVLLVLVALAGYMLPDLRAFLVAWGKKFLGDTAGTFGPFKQMSGKAKGVTLAAAISAAAIPTVQAWEGLRQVPYRDIVGVLTVCYGETQGVESRTYSVQECEAMLETRLAADYVTPLIECGGAPFVAAPLRVQAMASSLAYNVGAGGVCRSTAMKRIRAGDYDGACEAMTWFNKAGGVRVQGLVNRRTDEYKKCIGAKPL